MRIFRFIRTGATLCAGVAAGLLACGALAADVDGAHVLELYIHKSYGGYVFVRLDKAPASALACSINGYWQYTLPLTTEIDKKLFVLLVTAQSTGKQVSIGGMGSCNEFGAVESMAGMRLSSQ